jgi:hypothetical protein
MKGEKYGEKRDSLFRVGEEGRKHNFVKSFPGFVFS